MQSEDAPVHYPRRKVERGISLLPFWGWLSAWGRGENSSVRTPNLLFLLWEEGGERGGRPPLPPPGNIADVFGLLSRGRHEGKFPEKLDGERGAREGDRDQGTEKHRNRAKRLLSQRMQRRRTVGRGSEELGGPERGPEAQRRQFLFPSL